MKLANEILCIAQLPNNVQFTLHETLSSTSKVEINFFLLTPRHFNFVANKVKIFTGTTIQSYMLYKLMSHTEFYIFHDVVIKSCSFETC